MGKHGDWLALVQHWFPNIATDTLPGDTHVDAYVLDGTQLLARLKNSKEPFNALATAAQWVNSIQDYANNENDKTRVIIDRAFVVLLDTPRYVPKAKAATQQSRDGSGGGDDDDDEHHPDASVILDEEAYARLIKELGIDPENEYIIQREMKPCNWLQGNTVWRSNVLRWQVHSMALSETLTRCDVPEGRVLICDEGVVLESPEAYAAHRQVIFDEFGDLAGATPLERESLLSYIMETRHSRRHVRYSDGRVSPHDSTGMGEADVKLCNYITLEDGLSRFMVASQDSDIVLILLLHLKRLMAQATALGKGPDQPLEFSLFVDTQTPHDRATGTNRPMRFINVCALYKDLTGLFAREYPSIVNPIETFVALAQTLETDFTTRLDHKYTGVTRRVLWNTFSELHHDRRSSRNDGFLVFPPDAILKARKTRGPNEPMCRSTTRQCSPKIHFVLGGPEALRCEPYVLDPSSPDVLEYRLSLDESRFERFLYCVCQLRLARELKALRPIQAGQSMRSSGDSSLLPYYDDVDVLFVHADDIRRALVRHRAGKETEFKQSVQSLHDSTTATAKTETTAPKGTKKSGSTKPTTTSQMRPLSAIMGDISLAVKHTPTTAQFNTKELDKMINREIPPHYGIPTRLQMRARIRRMGWIMNYLQNASVCNLFASCYADSVQKSANGSHALSVYGWRARPLAQTDARAFNSGYYDIRLGPSGLQVLVAEETDELAA